MKRNQLRAYKTIQDKWIKIQIALGKKVDVAKLKRKRRVFRDKQQAIIEQRLEKRVGKRNLNVLNKKELKKKRAQTKRAQKQSERLKFQRDKGAIEFKSLVNDKNLVWKENFVSSNVDKFKRQGNNLLVGFLNGSIYIYYGVGRLFIGLINAGSKGKWVWKNLRRKKVSYSKIR